MVTNVGPAPSHNFVAEWQLQTAMAGRERMDGLVREYNALDEPTDYPPEPEQAPPPTRRTRAKVEQAMAAIRAATGISVELDAPYEAAEEPVQAAQAPAGPTPPPVEPEGGSRAYVVREQSWRTRLGLPARRTSIPPSRTPEVRRQRHISQKAERLGISHADAERATPARGRR